MENLWSWVMFEVVGWVKRRIRERGEREGDACAWLNVESCKHVFMLDRWIMNHCYDYFSGCYT